MRILWTILIVCIFASTLKAQQVTSVDCCVDVGSKATIAVNDNTANNNSLVAPAKPVPVDNNGKCDFKLAVSSNTSAGVYNSSDNLIRTLWNGVRYDAGCYSLQWDGLLDDGTQAPVGNYNIKILTNNVTYEWDTFGNTTKGNATLRNYGGISAIATAGNKVFFGHGFYERSIACRSFNTSDIQNISNVVPDLGFIVIGVATDGINNYWLGVDQYQTNNVSGNSTNYFYVSKVSDDSEIVLSAASQHPTGTNGVQKNVLGWYSAQSGGHSYTGIAATRGTGGYVFISRADSNLVYTFSKQTGAMMTKTTISSAALLAVAGNKLWVQSGNNLLLYNVDAAGNLTPTSISILNVQTRGLATNADGNLLKFAEEQTRTIRTHNGQTGAYVSSFGRVNGYTGNPVVANNAFSFYRYPTHNEPEFANPCIAIMDNGSYWFNDPGNNRLMHFTQNDNYIEQISYVPSFRSISADPNNPSRVFVDELEYQIDYNKPLDNGTNSSWILIKNWKENTVTDPYQKFKQVITFPNGKTYAKGSISDRLYMLDNTVGSVDVGAIAGTLQADGSLENRLNYGNNYLVVNRALLTGYAANGMPQWGTPAVLATTPNYTDQQPYFFYNSSNVKGGATNASKQFFFNPWWGTVAGFSVGYGKHFGSIKTGQTDWNFKTSNSTFFDYHGDYPRNGDFDIGNNDFLTQHSENCGLLVQGTDLFWNVNAEFWQANSGASGVNIWNHFNEDGLLIGNFGVTAPQAAVNGEKGMAGNSFSTALVKVGSDYYIYHCDENRWGSGHRWKVSNLNTIKEVSIPVTINTPVKTNADSTDLMVGLPYRSSSFTGGYGWKVQQGLSLVTNKMQYAKNTIDIALGGSNNLIITRSLNNNVSLSSWMLTGGINYLYSEVTFGNSPDGSDNFNYLEILDTNGKIISRFIGNQADTRNNYYPRVWFNKTLVAEGSNVNTTNKYFYRDISFNYSNGTLTFKHQDYPAVTVITPFENGADLSKPATIRINQGGNRTRYINLYKLKFSYKRIGT